MSELTLTLAESELKIVLEGLIELERKLATICETSKDEDEVADRGNDLIELRLLLGPIKERAVEKYGRNILNFSQETL